MLVWHEADKRGVRATGNYVEYRVTFEVHETQDKENVGSRVIWEANWECDSSGCVLLIYGTGCTNLIHIFQFIALKPCQGMHDAKLEAVWKQLGA